MTDVQTTTGTEPHLEEPGRPGIASTRRLVLLGAGAVSATAVLAACGSSTTATTNTTGTDYSNNPAPAGSRGARATGAGGTDDGNSGSGSSSKSSSAKSGSSNTVALAKVADVPTGGGVIAGGWVITQPSAGKFKAFSKVCTHTGCDVSRVDNGVIICPCHGSKFSIDDGSPTAGPATKALAEKKVKAEGGKIVAA